MLKLAVFGDPIAQSKSPLIHQSFASETGVAVHYTAIRASANEFAAALAQFFADGGVGANVTSPLKTRALELATHKSAAALTAGAANVLHWHENAWWANNTDGTGLLRDLTQRHRLDLGGKRILLYGAGGAARGCLAPLLEAGPAEICLSARTMARATELANEFAQYGPLHSASVEGINGPYDLLINASSAGLQQTEISLPSNWVDARTRCYDLSYGAAAAPFIAWARAQGVAQALDGLGMLVEQAADSFALWTGVRPNTQTVYTALRLASPLGGV
jgi:shikimate dehydrogenase